jgi:hypothetical protein
MDDHLTPEINSMNRMARRMARISTRLGVLALAGALALGCGSSSSSGTPTKTGGTGGATTSSSGGTPGSGGATTTGSGGATATGQTGSGGATATGSGGATTTSASGGATASANGGGSGTTMSGGGGSGAFPLCTTAPKNKGACVSGTDMPCANTCGPSKTGYKNCTCNSNVWDCPACAFNPGDYSCYRLPATETACPADPTDPSGMMLVQSSGVCTAPACMPCGSATASSYRDSSNALKVGYCVCVAGTSASKWSCASKAEWPPQM